MPPGRRAALTALAASALLPAQATAQPSRRIGGAITDVPGLKVGHYTETRRPTGCTVLIAEAGATAGVDVRGAAPGTRDTDLLDPSNLVEKINAILLSGGSAYGLDAAGGVMRWLEEHGIGYKTGPAIVPIVPAAILFDLGVGDPTIRPDAAAGYSACQSATTEPPAQGSVGAGTGATVGKLFGMSRAMKGGIGTASLKLGKITVGALVAVNAVGDIRDSRTNTILASARSPNGKTRISATDAILAGDLPAALQPGMATTIGVVATDAVLTKAQCRKLAQQSHDGLARAIEPVHTLWDGDTMFALATGQSALPGNMMTLGLMAARVTEAAILNAILHATGLPALPSATDLA